jgi:ubiquinone/menaquinone biosynthesis C-methylase UbiE
MFEVAENYERQMGRWSRQLAPLLIEFVSIPEGAIVLDVGCGTGSLATTVVTLTRAAQIVGIDASKNFIEYARSHAVYPGVSFTTGDAQKLAYPDASFDYCLSSLAINHIKNAPQAVREMQRVTKPGGVVATAMWDGTGANPFNDCFWDVAIALDASVTRASERQGAYSSAEALSSLWRSAGLDCVETKRLEIPVGFASFAEFWSRYIDGQGPSAAYVVALPEDHREALKQKLREHVLRDRSDGAFGLQASAWAVRGNVP